MDKGWIITPILGDLWGGRTETQKGSDLPKVKQ